MNDYLEVNSANLEYKFIRPKAIQSETMIVFLHEGLGSIAQWKNFPEILCNQIGLVGLLYSRHGYGKSTPLNTVKNPDFLHEEALQVLPELLNKLNIKNPILLGHSDGASIALIASSLKKISPKALIVIAPHLFLEPITINGVLSAISMFENGALKSILSKYHTNPTGTFHTWSKTWLQPECKNWNIEEYVKDIACPILAIQGVNDNYGTLEQIRRIGQLNPKTILHEIPNGGHSPHLEDPISLTTAIKEFIKAI